MTWGLDTSMVWNTLSGPNVISFLANAAYLLQQDGSRSGDSTIRARAAQLQQQVGALTAPTVFSGGSPSEDVVNLINLYDMLRADLDRAHLIYSAPPIDVALGSAVSRTPGTPVYPPPLEADPALLYQTEHQASTMLQNGDPLRVAIIGWAAWWRGLLLPDTFERTRARRLSAWARDRITALVGQINAAAPPAPPVAPPHLPGQDSGPTANPAPAPAPQAAPSPRGSGSNGDLMLVALGVLALLSMKKRGRR